MYNMQFSFLGMKFTLGIVLLIIFLYWLMWGHVLYSCSNGSSIKESLTVLTGDKRAKNMPLEDVNERMNPGVVANGRINYLNYTEDDNERMNREIAGAELSGGPVNTADGRTKALGRLTQIGGLENKNKYNVVEYGDGDVAEGFTGANTNYGESSKFSLTMGNSVDTSSWFTPDLTYAKGTSGGPGVQSILNRQQQPVPLPEGELLMFANTPFKPECCPNAFSNSTGCACMTVDQYNYLINRGGNNVPYSEY